MRIGYFGEEGTFSEDAARLLYPDRAPVCFPSFGDVIEELANGELERAVLPLENSVAGPIGEVYDLLLAYPTLSLVGELRLRVRHNLLAPPGVRLEDVREILSHPMALAQCTGLVRRLHARPLPAASTAAAARIVSSLRPPGQAALASRRAGALHGLTVLEEGVENDPHNQTRFVALSREPVMAEEGPRTSTVAFSLPEGAGALYRALGAFADRDIDLRRLLTRPSGRAHWEYVFVLDFEGEPERPDVREALAELGRAASHLRLLGSYAWTERLAGE